MPCSAVVVACFRADGNLLLLQPGGPGAAWDLPHGPLPRGREPAEYGAQLLATQSGVTVAAPLYLFGILDWGGEATAAGWGWTACLFGLVGRVAALPRGSWAARRAFLPLDAAFNRNATDPWQRLRRETLEEAAAVFDSVRDYWLIESLDALALHDLEDVLE